MSKSNLEIVNERIESNWHGYDEPTAVWSAQGGQPEEKNLLKNEKRNPQNHQNKNRTKEYEGIA